MRHAILLFRLVRFSWLGLFCGLAATSLLQAGVGDGFEPAATVPAAIETGAGSEGRSTGDRGDTRQDARSPSGAPEMVFISDDIIGFEMIAAAARPRHGVVILDHRHDGLAQIVDTLRGRPELGAIHLITHGEVGKINLGTRLLDATAVDGARDELSGVRRALGGRGDFLIYGCNVADGAEGRAFVQRLGHVIGGSVAASSRATGTPAAGGHGGLDFRLGALQAEPINLGAAGWTGVLATVFDAAQGTLVFRGGFNSTNIVGTGTATGDIVRFNNVITIGAQAIDAVVTTTSSNITFSTYDSTTNPSTQVNPLQPNIVANLAGGNIQLKIDFYLGGTYTGVGTGTPVTLQNVVVNSYDIDSSGGTDRQFQDFKGFRQYELANSTTLSTTVLPDGSVRFQATTATNNATANLTADGYRARVYYDSISSFQVRAGVALGTGTAFFAFDFSVGPAWTGVTTVTGTPAANLAYSATSFAEAAANDGSITATSTITLANTTFTGTNGAALPGVTFGNVPAGLTAVVTRVDTTHVTLSFSGNATAHAIANNLANVSVTFGDTSFAGNNAAAVTGYTRADLTINFADPAALTTPTITVTPGTYTYSGTAQGPGTAEVNRGGSAGTITLSYVGTGTTTYGPSATAPTAAGTYTVTASVAATATFNAASSSATAFTIGRKAASVTPTAASKTFGAVDPTFTGTLTGFVAADNVTATYSRTAGETVAGSPYTVSATLAPTGVLANYTVTSNTASFTITQATPTITVTPGTYTYNGTAQGPGTAEINRGGSTGAITLTYVGTGTTVYGPSATPPTAAGTYTVTASVAADATYNAASSSPTAFTIPKVNLTGTFTASDKIYDGNTTATVTARNLTGVVGADVVTLTGGTAAFDTKNVGTGKTVTLTGATLGGANAGNYTLATVSTTTAAITAKALTITGLTAQDKVYTGTLPAALTGTAALAGIVGAETVALTGTAAGAFATVGVGAGKNVTVSGLTLTGGDAGNYTLTPLGLTAAITTAPLTVTAENKTKTYDGATYTGGYTVSYAGFVNSETTGVLGGTLSFGGAAATATQAGAHTITPSGLTSGNYTLTFAAGSLTIAPKALTITASNDTKVFGGIKTYGAGSTAFISAGLVGAETIGTVTLTASGGTATGATVGNYTLTPSAATGGTFTAANYAITYADGQLAVTASGSTITVTPGVYTYNGAARGPVAADVNTGGSTGAVTLSYVGTGGTTYGPSATPPTNAGNYTVTASVAADANFNAASSSATAFTIAPKALTITASNDTKVFGGTKTYGAGSTAFTSLGLLGAETIGTVTLTASGGATTGATVGNYTLTPSAATGGTFTAANYAITYADGQLSVTAFGLTGTFTASDKIYDGNTTATVTARNLTGVVGADVVTLTGGTAAFDTKNVGTGKTVTLTGAALGGANAGNYTLATVSTTTAAITAKALTITGLTAQDKVYTGTLPAALTGTAALAGIVGAETVALTGTAAGAFATVGVGAAKNVTVSGLTLTGGDAGNYTLTPLGLTAAITTAPLTVTAENKTKTYDGATYTGGYTVSYAGFVNSETTGVLGGALSFGGAAATATQAGAHTITPSGLTSGNYTLTFAAGSLTIAPKALTITASNDTKVFGGIKTYGAAATAFTSAGLVGAETIGTVTLTASGGTTTGATVGNYTLTPSAATGGTFTAANYAITYADGQLSVTASGSTITVTPGVYTYNGAARGPVAADVNTGGSTGAVTLSYVGTGGTTYGPSATPPTNAGNYTVTASVAADVNFNAASSSATAFTIAQKALTITASNDTKVFGSTKTYGAGSTAFTSAGLVGAETIGTVTLTASGGTATGATVGNYALTPSAATGGTFTAANYAITYADGQLSVTASGATITVTPGVYTYNGAARGPVAADVNTGGSTGAVTLSYVGTGGTTYGPSATPPTNAGNYTVTASVAADVNFNAASSSATAFTIAPKALTITASNDTKVFGGTKTYGAGSTAFTSAGLVGAETIGTVTLTASGGTTTGATVGNYTLTPSAATGGTFTAANYAITYADGQLAVTAFGLTGTFTASDKIYDGNTTATVAARNLTGVVGADVVTLTGGTATFDTKDVGAGKTVTLTGATLAGANATNYTLATVSTTTAAITAKALMITGLTAQDKVYTGTLPAALTGTAALAGIVGAEAVALTGTAAGAFATAGVGAGKNVTVSGLTLTGGDAGNYTLTPLGLTAAITTAPLTVTAENKTKTYDGATYTGGYTVSYTGFVNTETIGVLGGTLSFGGAAATATNAGAHTITPSGLTSGNYTLTFADGSLTIAQKALTITASNDTKVFGGTKTYGAGSTAFISAGLVGAETIGTVTLTASGGTATGATVGNYTLTPSAATGGTFTAANYAITYADGQLAVTAFGLTGTFTASDKIYDGNTTTTVAARNLTGVVGADVVTLTGGTATFDTKDVGAGKTVTLTGATLTGANATNYTLATVSTTTAAITAKALTITGLTAQDKVYTGTLPAALTGTAALAGIVGAEAVALTGTAAGAFATVGVGAGKNVTVSGLTLTGGDAGNYTLTPLGLTAAITTAPLTVTAENKTKTYDGATYTGGYTVSYTGFVNSETTGVLGGTLSFGGAAATATQAGAHAITPSGLTSDNYTVTFTDGTLTIAKKGASVTPTAAAKIFGTGDPFLTGTRTGFMAVDNITATYSRTAGESVGSYPVTATLAPASVLANYDIVYGTDQLTIGKASATITWPQPAAIVYGTPLTAAQLNAVGSVPGTLTYSPVGGTVLEPGTYTLSVSFMPADAINYNGPITATVTLVVELPSAPVAINDTVRAVESSGVALSSRPASLTGKYGTLTAAADGTFVDVANDALPAVEALDVGQTPGLNPLGNVLTNDTGIAITVRIMGGVALTSGPATILGQYGTLTAAADGTFAYVVNNALPAVEALNVGQALTDAFDYTLGDRFNRTAGARLSITIAGANDAPVAVAITLPPATAGRAFGPITVAPFTDVDNALLTYTVTGLPAGVVFDPVTRTFSGTPGSVGNFTLTLTASDGESSASTTFTLQVTAPPVNTVPSGPMTFTGDPARVVGPDGTVFAVADADSAELTVTLSAGVGLLTLPNRTGLTLGAGSGLNETSLTFRGLVRDLNAAMAQLIYQAPAGFFGQDTITITSTDERGNTDVDRIDPPFTVALATLGGTNVAASIASIGSGDKQLVSGRVTQFDASVINGVSVSGTGTAGQLVVGSPTRQDGSVQETTVSVELTYADGSKEVVPVKVTIYNPKLQLVTRLILNPQTSLYEQRVEVTNTTPYIIDSFRVLIPTLPSGVMLYSRSTTTASGQPAVEDTRALKPGESRVFIIEYFAPNVAQFPEPAVALEINSVSALASPLGTTAAIDRTVVAPNGRRYIEFATVLNQSYWIQYRDSATASWETSAVPVAGTGTSINWLDDGWPKTNAVPTAAREYRLLVAAPGAGSLTLAAQPQPVQAALNAPATLQVAANGAGPFTYQWYRDGEPVAGATGAAFSVANATLADEGDYHVVVNDGKSVVHSQTARLALISSNPGRIANLAVRAQLDASGQPLITGFVIEGNGTRPVLMRSVGETLRSFGLANAVANPALQLYRGSTLIAENDDWATDVAAGETLTVTDGVGAFPLGAAAKDAALVRRLVAGNYLIQSQNRTGAGGEVLVELYAAPGRDSADSRVTNVSTRATIVPEDGALIAGLTIEGTTTLRLMARVVGPGLASFGVTDALADPTLTLYAAGGSVPLATNDDWASVQTAVEGESLFRRVGAFDLKPGSRDAVIVTRLPPGAYTLVAQGKGADAGQALIEIYLID